MALMVMDFRTRVYEVVRQIPRGMVMTYGDVAKEAGSPGAARAVGTILSQNYDPAIPCHRVIRSDGRPGQYNRGAERKREILTQEGAMHG